MRKVLYLFGYCFCIIAIISMFYKLVPVLRPLIYIEVPILGEPSQYSLKPKANKIGIIFTIGFVVISYLIYKIKFKFWIIEKPLKPFIEGILLSLIINLTMITLFMFSISWDLNNLSIDNLNSLILIIGLWQWIYIIPIDILLTNKYKKGIVTGVNVSSGILTVLNVGFILFCLIYLSIHGVGGSW